MLHESLVIATGICAHHYLGSGEIAGRFHSRTIAEDTSGPWRSGRLGESTVVFGGCIRMLWLVGRVCDGLQEGKILAGEVPELVRQSLAERSYGMRVQILTVPSNIRFPPTRSARFERPFRITLVSPSTTSPTRAESSMCRIMRMFPVLRVFMLWSTASADWI